MEAKSSAHCVHSQGRDRPGSLERRAGPPLRVLKLAVTRREGSCMSGSTPAPVAHLSRHSLRGVNTLLRQSVTPTNPRQSYPASIRRGVTHQASLLAGLLPDVELPCDSARVTRLA